MNKRWLVTSIFGLLIAVSSAAQANDETCTKPSVGNGQVAAVMAAIQGHILGKAVYAGLFRRPN